MIVRNSMIVRNNINSCKSCWWQEGGLCYVDNPPRDKNGRSINKAISICDKFQTKRSVLSKVIPNDMLYILSEYSQKK